MLNKKIHDWCDNLGRVKSLAARVAHEFFSTIPPEEVCKITDLALGTVYNAIIRMVVTKQNIFEEGEEEYLKNVIMMKAQKRSGKERQMEYDICRPYLLAVARKFSQSPNNLLGPSEIPSIPPLTFLKDLRKTLVTDFKVSMRRYKGFVVKSIKKVLVEADAQGGLGIPKRLLSYWARVFRRQLFSPNSTKTEKKFEFPESKKFPPSSDMKDTVLSFVEKLHNVLPKGRNLWSEKTQRNVAAFIPVLKFLRKKLDFSLTPIGS